MPALTASTNGAEVNRGVVLDARPNRSGKAAPDVVDATLMLATEDILSEQRGGGREYTGKRQGGRGLHDATDPAKPEYRITWYIVSTVRRAGHWQSPSVDSMLTVQSTGLRQCTGRVSLLSSFRSIVSSMSFRVLHGVFV